MQPVSFMESRGEGWHVLILTSNLPTRIRPSVKFHKTLSLISFLQQTAASEDKDVLFCILVRKRSSSGEIDTTP